MAQKCDTPLTSGVSRNSCAGQFREPNTLENANPQDLDLSLVYHVQSYVPKAEGEELMHRVALLKARDWAASLLGQTDCALASRLAHEAHELAGRMVFRIGETTVRLQNAVLACRRLVGAAMAVEFLDTEETPL